MRLAASVLLTGLLAFGAQASPLFTANGDWAGEGRIATELGAPMEQARCRIEAMQVPDENAVDFDGRCAVAGGARRFVMRYVEDPGEFVRAGYRSPTDDVTIQYRGTATDNTVVLETVDPIDIDGIPYRSRVTVTFASDTEFTFEQIMRAETEEDWLLVVEVTFLQ